MCAAKAVLWKHTIARQKAKGRYPQAALHIVSFGADKTNRSPTFDLDLADLLDPATGEPLEYAAARALFERDPSQRWAAYVAGTVLVLMREKGLRCSDSLAILVHSAVPEGKGVSSSAAVEVTATHRSVPPPDLRSSPDCHGATAQCSVKLVRIVPLRLVRPVHAFHFCRARFLHGCASRLSSETAGLP